MIGELKDLTLCRDGGQLLTIKVTGDMRQQFDQLHGRTVSIDIKEHRNRRSMSANAYFHVLVNQLARKLGISDTECKRRMIFDYGTMMRQGNGQVAACILPDGFDVVQGLPDLYAKPCGERMVNGRKSTMYVLYMPSHLLDSKEMSQLIDGVVDECKQFGIETMTPAELHRLQGYGK